MPLRRPPRFVRHAAALLAAAALVLLAATTFDGRWAAVRQACLRIGPGGLLLPVVLTLLNLQLRFARWQLYLRAQGHALPRWLHWRLFVAGFAFALTPAGAGDASRAWLLRGRGVDPAHSLAALLSERASDLLVLLLLGALLHVWLLALALALGAALLLPRALRVARRRLLQRLLPRLLRRLLRQARRCHAPALLWRANLLGLAAWCAEALAFHAIGSRIGLALSLPLSAGIYALSLLAGGLSAAPGGLGGTEMVMVALLVGCGANLPDALATTLLTRLATLWFTVVLGGSVLASLRLAGRGGAATSRA